MTARAPSSKRNKARRLEYAVAAELRKTGLDPDAKRMPMSGAWAHFKGDIYTKLPICIECKNQEKVKLWEFWEQAKSQCPMGLQPLLVVGGNHRPMLAIVELDAYLDLRVTEKQYLQDIELKR